MGDRADQALVSAAMAMALVRRQPKPDTIHPSERGTQPSSMAYQQQLRAAGIVISMSRKSYAL